MKSLFCTSSAWVWKVRVLNESVWPNSVTITKLPLCSSRKRDCQKLLYVVKNWDTHCSVFKPPQEVLLLLLLLLFNVPETNSVPVGVEGLQILLIVDPLFAACTHRQTSSGCKKNKEKNSSAPSQKMGQIVCFCTRAERGEARRGESGRCNTSRRTFSFRCSSSAGERIARVTSPGRFAEMQSHFS